MNNEIAEIIDALEHVLDDQSERYVMTVTDKDGPRQKIIGRQEYLEFILDNTIDELCKIHGMED